METAVRTEVKVETIDQNVVRTQDAIAVIHHDVEMVGQNVDTIGHNIETVGQNVETVGQNIETIDQNVMDVRVGVSRLFYRPVTDTILRNEVRVQ
jgi:phage-related protein